MVLRFEGFEWDDGNEGHCAKHGMTRPEIEQVLRGSPRIAPDLKHSNEERRFLALGRTDSGRAAYVVFTIRRELIRPLSARFMHAREAAKYGA